MKKRFVYMIALFVFAITSGFIILKYKNDKSRKESHLFPVIPRKGGSESSEWALTRKISNELIQKIKSKPSDFKSLNALTAIYLQEARTSGNYSYYDNAATNCVSAVLKKDPINFEALTYRALIYLSQHHFAEGLKVAEQLKKLYPYSAFVYGISVDANVELGNYKTAVEDAEKMISIRPDMRSYSRISYLREIHGDIPGAIEAMKMAVDAGSAGSESTEWARVQLGKLYEQIGEMKYAEMYYTIALENRPGYSYALAGLARIAIGAKDYNRAIQLYRQADSLSNDYSFKEALVDAYNLAGQQEQSLTTAKTIIDDMEKAARAMAKGDSIGHYADREMAYAYLAVDNLDKAIDHALLEFNRRPNNIDASETVAWAYYCKGDYLNASLFIEKALQTNCKNPMLLCHAALIYAKANKKNTAKGYLEQGLKCNPNISPSLLAEAQRTFKSDM